MVTNRRIVKKEGSDFYPTPTWGTQALLDSHGEYISGNIWEPACGDGSMSEILKTHDYIESIYSSDLYDRGYTNQNDSLDFLNSKVENYNPEWVITNPPFNKAEEFLEKSLEISKTGVALLLRTSFLESEKRYNNLWKNNTYFQGIYTFSQRLSMYPKGQHIKAGGTTSYSWFIWNKISKSKDPFIRWIPPIYDKSMKNGNLYK